MYMKPDTTQTTLAPTQSHCTQTPKYVQQPSMEAPSKTLAPTQSHCTQTPKYVQQPSMQAPSKTNNSQSSFAQAMQNNTASNSFVGAGMQTPFQVTQKQNPPYVQQANVPAATYSWNTPIQSYQFPMTTVPTVQVQNPAYTQPSGLRAAAPTQSILSNAPTRMRLYQPDTQQSQPILNKKEVHPDNFDGTGKTEWSDYLVHFEQCAKWNQWTDAQKAQMLSIHLRGEAQRLLSGLTVLQLGNYDAIKQIISDRYEPKQKDVTYRCQFRYRKREKAESASDYGYHLNRLAQKAYPNLTLNQLEVNVIDQFITDLNNYELQKHVQFGHPKSLYEAIGLATEFEALEGSIDRVKKPRIESENIAPIVSKTEPSQSPANMTLEQLDTLIEKKLTSLSLNAAQSNKSPSPNTTSEHKEGTSATKARSTDKPNPKADKHCTYCKRNYHTIEECRTRKYHERRRAEQQDNQPRNDAAYVIKSEPAVIPEIEITPAVVEQSQQGTLTDSTPLPNKDEVSHTTTAQVLQPVLTSQIHDNNEINTNLKAASCLYLNATIFQTPLKLLLDTGSPDSILSQKYFEKLQATHDIQVSREDIKLTAADGSHLEISGKVMLQFKSENLTFKQEFIIANIKGIVGILGIDFLVANDGSLKIKKQILKTASGKLKMYKQASNACAHIVITDTVTVPANTEKFLQCKVDQPLLRKENICSVEPANYLTSKGCFVARTLVDPACDDIVMSVVNLSDQAVKINQQSVLGQLEDVEEICTGDKVKTMNSSCQHKLPDHLQVLLENSSKKLSATEKQQLSELLIKYEDIFIKPDGVLGQTDLVEHDIETGDSKPIKIPPRRIPIFKRNQVDEELEKMIAQGIVEPSDSPWSAPICLVKKKDGTCRFCIDF